MNVQKYVGIVEEFTQLINKESTRLFGQVLLDESINPISYSASKTSPCAKLVYELKFLYDCYIYFLPRIYNKADNSTPLFSDQSFAAQYQYAEKLLENCEELQAKYVSYCNEQHYHERLFWLINTEQPLDSQLPPGDNTLKNSIILLMDGVKQLKGTCTTLSQLKNNVELYPLFQQIWNAYKSYCEKIIILNYFVAKQTKELCQIGAEYIFERTKVLIEEEFKKLSSTQTTLSDDDTYPKINRV